MTKLSCVLALALTGCALDALDAPAPEPDVTTPPLAIQLDADCNPLVCPGNSDLIAALGPYELDETGVESSTRGWRITGLSHPLHTVLAIDVQGAELRMITQDAGTLIAGALQDLTLHLENKSGDQYDLKIDGYLTSKVPFYAGGWPLIEGYHMSYAPLGGHFKNLCPYETYDDAGVAGDWVVFWQGDRYKPETGEIFASGAAVGSWFNLSCAGEATIKMMRARTGGAVAPTSSVAQHQATLNMFTASYCGPNGDRYTQLGQPLQWNDSSGPSAIGAVSAYEAIWDEHGAVCLNEPRFVPKSEVACAKPRCTIPQLAWWSHYGLLLSGNP